MEEARSLRTTAAPRQKLMNERATVVATTTLAVVDALDPPVVAVASFGLASI
jgi:hypothetical protein